ncbi:MAG: 3'(2'),5'-bisphosphate nucleotidase CysQ [Crocinitomicaceae bacterium]|nr:3'(2'),5'-bisphosphate nucleotidase CysQ [Crocinitomicaceae bacterium]
MRASIEASNAIMSIYQTDFKATRKEDGSPVTIADLESSKIISEHLAVTRIPITGEEQEVDAFETRSKWKENWCVDPLDGTRMFLRKNGEFSVNIAHIVNGISVFGIIARPTTGEILFGGPEFGAYITKFIDIELVEKWRKLESKEMTNEPLMVTCSRIYTPDLGIAYMQELEESYGAFNYLMKGSALKFFDLAQGNADIYPRFAPTMEWDIAAGQAILEALGGSVVDLDNRPLRYNKESLYNPYFLAKTKAIIAE